MNEPNKSSWIYFLLAEKSFALGVAIVLALGLSVGAYFLIPIEVMPKESTPPVLFLHVGSREAMSPERMELGLTIPVEGAARTIPGIVKISSNTNGGGVSVSLNFKPRTNLDLAEFNLQEALQDLETKGILDLHNVSVSRMNPDATPVTKLSVTYGLNVKNPARTIKDDLRPGLEAIPEVAKVEISGIEPLEFQYNIPASRAQELGLNSQGLSAFLSFQSMRESLGESAFGSDRRITALHAHLSVEDLAQLQEQPLKQGSPYTLREVASEKIFDHSKEEILHKNGEPSVFVEIYAREGANLFDLSRHLTDHIANIGARKDDLSGLKFETVFDKTDDLRKAIDDVFRSLYEAMIITCLVVFLFLRQWRTTLVICASTPLTLLLTVFILYTRGISLNILTLSGLILGIGMVVDSAILVVGRIVELNAEMNDGRGASARGATQVFGALLMSTLTNACIFLPVAFLEGGDSFTDILKAVQIPILASLGSSMVVSLLFLPLGMRLFQTAGLPAPIAKSMVSDRITAAFRWLKTKRLVSLSALLVASFFVFNYIADIPQTDIESPRDPYSTLSVQFGNEMPPARRFELFNQFERSLLNARDQIGFRFTVSEFNPQLSSGSISVYTQTANDTEQDAQDKNLAAFLSKQTFVPGFNVSLGWSGGPISQQLQQSDSFKFNGPKMVKLIDLTKELKVRLLAQNGIANVQLEQEQSGARDMVFLPYENVLTNYGVTLAQISSEISRLMSAASISNLNFNGQMVGAKISFVPDGPNWTVEAFKRIKIQLANGRYAALMDLGQLTPTMITGSVAHRNGQASQRLIVTYPANISETDLSSVRSHVRAQVSSFPFPHGYGIPASDSSMHVEEMAQKTQFIMILSISLIYMLLAAMFESFLLPLAIIFTVPLALIFGVAGLKVLGMDLDVMARLSLVILVGIGVNSAIILIDLINSLRSDGIPRSEAVVIGCARRLKAVLTTTAIQILSVLPVALGHSKIMGIPYASLGICIISGMFFSTGLTLIVLPMLYEWADECETKIGLWLGFKANASTKGHSRAA